MESKQMAGTQANFRLSQKTQDLLAQASKSSGLTKTQVLEICVLRHALTVPELAESARAALAEIAAKNLQAHGTKDR